MSTKTVICPRSALRFCIPWLVLSLSCSSGDRLGGSKSGDSTVASHAQALTGTPPPICIFGESLVSVGAATNIHSDVGSNNSVAVQAGWGPDLPTLVAGDITSAGTVDLYGGDSNVAGTVRANGKITQQTGALADEVDPFTSQTVLQHDIPGKAVNPGTTSVTVEPGTGCVGNVLSPRPDQYGWVTVRRGCSLTLTPGEYHFASLDIDADATLIIQGPVKVFTQWGFRFADRAQLQGVLSPYDLQVYSGSSATIGNYVQDFRGILTAEQRVTVGTGVKFTGCMQANYLTLNPSSQFYHPGYAAPGNRGSLLEVELSSTSFPLPRVPSDPDPGCPPTVRLTFPAGRHQGKDFPTTVVELGNASLVAGNNCVYNEVVDQIPLAICENRDHPCVHHPDQWDDLAISWGGVSSIPLDGIRVTNFAAGADAEEPGNLSYFNLVYTTNTDLETGLYQPPPPPDPPRPQHNYEAGTRKVLAPGSLSLTPSPVSLAAEIEERRRMVTEWIIWNGYVSNAAPSFVGATRDDVDLDALPRTVREGTYDHGQAGAYKYAGDWTYGGTIAACSGTQMFYQSNYAEDYQTDFVDLLGNPLHRYECSYDPVTLEHYCHNSPGFWPNPRGTLQVWRQFPPLPIDNRALAKAVFDPVTGALTGFFEVTNPFGGNQNTWARSANQYEPKPGDYFWRFDRCWHGSSNRHAMTLVADPYHAAGGTNLNAPIFDGSNFFMVRDRDFTGQATQSIPALCDPATTPSLQCDCDGDGTAESYDCAPPRHNPDGETGVQQRLVDLGGGVCACGGLNNERRCPPATNPDGTPAPRYDFYVAESRSARELFVYSQKHDTKPFDWSVISQGLITQPSFDQTQPHQRPAMEALSFGRIDNDVYDDIFWKTPQNTIWIALSSDDYGFWRAPGVGASFQMIEAVDFGQLQADGQSLNSASDGFTDLVALTGSGAQMSVIVSVNDSSSPFAFSSWLVVESFPSLGHDVAWWTERMRFADFDGDGVTDIMRAVDGGWEISFRTGAPNWSGDFGNVAFYQFADLDYDGRTDIVTRYNNAWWWSSFANGWSAWAPFNTDFQGCDVGDVRFVNWDGDAPAPGSVRADLLCLSPLGDWQVVLDHDPANVVQIHARSDSAANLAFGNFKTVGDATDNNELIDDVLYFGGSPIEHLF